MQKITVVQEHAGAVGVLEEALDAELMVRLADGRHARVAREDLVPLEDGTLLLKRPLDQLTLVEDAQHAPVQATATVRVHDDDVRVREQVATLPRVEERVQIDKVERPTGSVRVRVVPTQQEQTVSMEVADTHVDVRRVAIGRIVDAPPGVREEGNVTIIPVFEEVLVVEKRLLLKEEIHVVRMQQTRVEERSVSLRSERVEISRVPA
jgi:stress response protein YsnF